MRLLLVAISIAITLAILDAGIVAGEHLMGHDRMYMFDSTLGWRVLPNLNGALTPYITYTDAHGFRILPNEPRDTEAFDVMLLGDSFCFGSWLSAEQTVAGMLKLGHPAMRIANTAVPGWGTDQETLALERYAPMLKPGGTVVLLTYVNDFDDIRSRWDEVRGKPWFTLSGTGLVLNRPDSLVNRFFWSTQLFSITAYLAARAFRIEPAIHGDDNYAAKLYGALLERMAAAVRTRQARLVVLYTGGREARTAGGVRWAGVARAAAERAGVKFFSLDDPSVAANPGMFIPGDIHWNAAGNRAAYKIAAARLDPLLRESSASITRTAE